jgi:hypothetical protein
MDEKMNAIRIKDNKQVEVIRKSKLIWKDYNTNEKYILHEDIELIY